MALMGKLEAEIVFKAHADNFYDIILAENHQLPNAASDKIHEFQVDEGDRGTHGSIRLCTYTVEGKVETLKELVEFDKGSKTVTLTALEGQVLDLYKNYKIVFKVIPKSEGGVVTITILYEKHKEDIPDPNHYLQFLANVMKDIDAHLLKL